MAKTEKSAVKAEATIQGNISTRKLTESEIEAAADAFKFLDSDSPAFDYVARQLAAGVKEVDILASLATWRPVGSE